jgi:hypothetical protein
VRWLWHSFGGGLGPRYVEWVLRDTAARTRWFVRYMAPYRIMEAGVERC